MAQSYLVLQFYHKANICLSKHTNMSSTVAKQPQEQLMIKW